MKIPKLKAIEEIIRNAKCPEDVFGDQFPGIEAAARMARRLELAKDSPRYPAGQQVMFSVAADKLRVYAEWARIADLTERYGLRLPYQFDASFIVTRFGRELYFMHGRSGRSAVLLGEFLPLVFQGYWANDTIEVMDGEAATSIYCVRHVGGHADQNHFFLDGAGLESQDRISASDFIDGTVLRVRSVMFTSFNRFLSAVW